MTTRTDVTGRSARAPRRCRSAYDPCMIVPLSYRRCRNGIALCAWALQWYDAAARWPVLRENSWYTVASPSVSMSREEATVKQIQATAMPWGKFRGRPVTTVATNYLRWVLRTCLNAPSELRWAIQIELSRRAAIQADRTGQRLASTQTVPTPAPDLPPAVEPAAIMRLLADLLAAGVRVIARGEGSVHLYGGLTPSLRDSLGRLHGDLDRLAAWVRWAAPTQPRVTPATQLMSRLAASGITLSALPDGTVAVSHRQATDPLATLTPRGRGEVWFRLAAGLPAPVAEPAMTRVHPGTAAGLHAYCVRRAAHATAAGESSKACRWAAYADAIAAVREGRGVVSPLLADLAVHCRRQASQLIARGRTGAAAKWEHWAQCLGA